MELRTVQVKTPLGHRHLIYVQPVSHLGPGFLPRSFPLLLLLLLVDLLTEFACMGNRFNSVHLTVLVDHLLLKLLKEACDGWRYLTSLLLRLLLFDLGQLLLN